MTLRDALSDHARRDGTGFPGERRTTTGLFAGDGGRLVHVGPDGSLRDFGYPLSGLTGIRRATFGIDRGDEVAWFDDGDQAYCEGTAMVRTTHDRDGQVVDQYDVSLAGAHVTAFEVPGGEDLSLVASMQFAPDGREGRVGQLQHGDAVEVFHADEHDFLASATGFDRVEGVVVGLDDYPDPARPSFGRAHGRYEEQTLTTDLVASVPVVDGTATLVTLPVDERQTTRAEGLARARDLAALAGDDRRDRAASAAPRIPAASTTMRSELVADLRALSLLSAPGGLRVAGPEFDPFYAHSGGYGYTWFRDDAEIARHLLAADRELDLGLSDWHERSARRYCETQLGDGTWPHRVWPFDGSIAPGWAHARLEAGGDADYQADQTASVVSFLAAYLDAAPDDLRPSVVAAVEDGLDGLDDSLSADGRPVVCQNAWENLTGRFAHTAATFLGAYARVAAAADLPAATRDRARTRADEVYAAIDDLWVPDREVYALREDPGGDLDDRLDSATLALAGAHGAYAAVADVDDRRRDRLAAHVGTTVDGLHRETPAITGLVRFEGDDWRTADQDREKVWTVSTGLGAHACASLAGLFGDAGDPRAGAFEERARRLLDPLLVDGSLCVAGGYLPEQFFDDGRPDSATPLGWSHAIRTGTVATLARRGALRARARGDD